LQEISTVYHVANDTGIDLSLLKDSLAKTPWERMQANDDALNFADRYAARWRNGMQNLSELTRRLIESQVSSFWLRFAAVAHGVTWSRVMLISAAGSVKKNLMRIQKRSQIASGTSFQTGHAVGIDGGQCADSKIYI